MPKRLGFASHGTCYSYGSNLITGVTTCYFDPQPKRRRKDFYDMEDILSGFQRALKAGKLVLVLELGRYGKTSLSPMRISEME